MINLYNVEAQFLRPFYTVNKSSLNYFMNVYVNTKPLFVGCCQSDG